MILESDKDTSKQSGGFRRREEEKRERKGTEEDCTGISFAEKTGVDEVSEYEI